MPLPILDYTWRFKVNQALPSSGVVLTDNQTLLLAIKNALTTAAGWTDSAGVAASLTTPWTVVASSNATIADGADNWTVPSDLVFSTGSRSWIVLRQTGINGQNIELCIDLNSNSTQGHNLSLVTSSGVGFDVSSPVVDQRPTAPDEFVFLSAAGWFTASTAAFSSALHVSISDGGQCTRVWGYFNGNVRLFWIFDKPKKTVVGWVNPSVVTICAALAPIYTVLNDAQRGVIKATNWFGMEILGTCFYSTEFYINAAVGQLQTTANTITGEWPLNRISMTCGTPGLYGCHGEFSDVWFGSVTPAQGDCYPASGTIQQFTQVGDLVLPWNQSTPVTS